MSRKVVREPLHAASTGLAGARVAPRRNDDHARRRRAPWGCDSSIPMVMPPPRARDRGAEEEAELLVGLAEELADDAGDRIAEDEDAAERGRAGGSRTGRTAMAITTKSTSPSPKAS